MTTADRTHAADGLWQSTHAAVPQRYRGVWRRTLLETPQGSDTTTTVLWLQTAHWHADVRIPAQRPDFSGVTSLAECSSAQRAFLATQQGFAGATEVTVSRQGEVCAWHRRVDFQPPPAGPDAGLMEFTPEHLAETGLYASYLEHWIHEAGSTSGAVVLQRLQETSPEAVGETNTMAAAGTAATPVELLLVAGDSVMHVRGRRAAWPPGILPDTRLVQMPENLLAALLDFTIAYGHRTAHGWHVVHATLPWLEGASVAVSCDRIGEARARLTWDGAVSHWQVLEWQDPG